jgi:AcrR family transcriptional regulator
VSALPAERVLSIGPMASPRRIAGPNAKNRAVLVDAAEQLMLEEGYAAVTSRRVAAAAELKPQLVHYYFRTMDDLFLAVFRRRADEGLVRLAEALNSGQPLRALWAHATDARGTALTIEFAALANHRKTIRTEIARYAERFRRQQANGLAHALRRDRIDLESVSPTVLSVLLTSVSVVLVMEQALGMSAGHAEMIQFVERSLHELEPTRRPAPVGSR